MAPFDHFIILAGMRTGSNFLESSLQDFPGIHGHGELFNPHFIGGPNRFEMFGLRLAERERDPEELIRRMRASAPGMHGFRFFHDHDPRILDICLNDPACAKIVLTRNPVESYVSREIARQTGQWRLSDMKHARTARIRFDEKAFAVHLETQRDFQDRIRHRLQVTGQTAFYIGYEEIRDPEVVNGIARYLGVTARSRRPAASTRVQNPQDLREKVVNFDEMQRVLAGLDAFSLFRTPNFEPARGPVIPAYVASPDGGLLFMPIKSGPTERVETWLADLAGVQVARLQRGFTQKTLRQWKRRNRGHQSFTVVRHPVRRLHETFVRHFLLPGPDRYAEIREILEKSYGLAIPEPDDSDPVRHRAAFLKFAQFVKGNLNGQTGIRVDGAWASQSEVLRGMGKFVQPAHVLNESQLEAGLGFLASQLGRVAPPLAEDADRSPVALREIYDDEVEASVRAAYQRDYMMFGFGPWAGRG